MDIKPNFSTAMRPAHLQAERLKSLPDKNAYNELVDSALGSDRFMDSAPEQALELSRLTRSVAKSVPDAESRFKLYQTCFDAAMNGTLAAVPGGAAALVAKVVLDILPNLDESSQRVAAGGALDAINKKAWSSPEAIAHADFAVQAGIRAGHTSKETQGVILQNGLGVIADLGTPYLESSQPAQAPANAPADKTAFADFSTFFGCLGCTMVDANTTHPKELDGQKVILLQQGEQPGTLQQFTGKVAADGPSFTGTKFRLSEQDRVFDSNNAIGYAVLPREVTSDTLAGVKRQLEKLQARKEATQEFVDRYAGQGHDVPDRKFSGEAMDGRQVSILYLTSNEWGERSGDWAEFTGTVVARDPEKDAIFALTGNRGKFNSNHILQVAFLDGRAPQ